jgi:hypothetical protein
LLSATCTPPGTIAPRSLLSQAYRDLEKLRSCEEGGGGGGGGATRSWPRGGRAALRELKALLGRRVRELLDGAAAELLGGADGRQAGQGGDGGAGGSGGSGEGRPLLTLVDFLYQGHRGKAFPLPYDLGLELSEEVAQALPSLNTDNVCAALGDLARCAPPGGGGGAEAAVRLAGLVRGALTSAPSGLHAFGMAESIMKLWMYKETTPEARDSLRAWAAAALAAARELAPLPSPPAAAGGGRAPAPRAAAEVLEAGAAALAAAAWDAAQAAGAPAGAGGCPLEADALAVARALLSGRPCGGAAGKLLEDHSGFMAALGRRVPQSRGYGTADEGPLLEAARAADTAACKRRKRERYQRRQQEASRRAMGMRRA